MQAGDRAGQVRPEMSWKIKLPGQFLMLGQSQVSFFPRPRNLYLRAESESQSTLRKVTCHDAMRAFSQQNNTPEAQPTLLTHVRKSGHKAIDSKRLCERPISGTRLRPARLLQPNITILAVGKTKKMPNQNSCL